MEEKFAQLITECNQDNELGKKEAQEIASVAQFTQLSESFAKKTGNLKKAFTKKQNSGRGAEREVRRCFRCDSEDHVIRDCPMLAADKRKDEKRSDRDDSGFERKRNKKHNFPLKSAMKRQDKKKDRRSSFFDKW